MQYANAAQADNRDWHTNGESGTYWHRRLVQDFPDAHIKFTWDNAVVEDLTKQNLLLWGICEDLSHDLESWGHSNQAAYFVPALNKVKEVHLTSTAKPRTNDGSGSLETFGYFASFNPATGVLTTAVSKDGVRGVENDDPFAKWIQQNVH